MNEKVRPRWLSVIEFPAIKVSGTRVVGGTLSGALVIALMFALCFYQGRWQRERGFVVGLALLGLTLDSVWIHLGILDFGSGTW